MFDVASSLTDRDRHILRLIRWHRVLTTSQVQAMFFSDRNTAQHRMTRLYQLRLVERFRPPHGGREAEYHYVLDRLGAFVVAVMAVFDLDREVKVRWRTGQALSIATSQRLAHMVGTNDVVVRLVAAARHDRDAELVTWWGERYCKANLGEVVRPDGVGVWREGEAVVTFCLEYDRGTEPLARISAKADEYARLERAWGIAFWLLVVVPGPRRERGVRAALAGSGLAAVANCYQVGCPSARSGGLGAPRCRGDPATPGRAGRLAPAGRVSGQSGRSRPPACQRADCRGGATAGLQSAADRDLMDGWEPKEHEAMRCVIYLRVSTREQAEKGEGEEGFSIPAQREACTRHIRDAGWLLTDEYVDRGESARSADRPALQAMLARIAEDRDVDAVVVHKIDRLVRNMEDHVAIRALLRRRGVALVSVTENVEETASGRLVEGIHALMAEFYSANLANEIKKGLTQKAKQGGFPHGAPLGCANLREVIGGRQVARIVPDPERAPLITGAFDCYATGDWTLQRLAGELAHRGLTNRGRRGKSAAPITWQGLAKILANPVYVGIVEWNGVQYPGTHEPLVDPEVFRRVQELLAARAARGTRERKHPHYLKGLLHCGVCGRRLSIQHSKGRYTYFFCLGQKNDPLGTCREPYIAADDLEAQIEDLYRRIQLPESWAERLREEMAAEIEERQASDVAQRALLTSQLAKAENERRKLLDAYYGGAIDVPTLKTEQTRIGSAIDAAQDRLADLDANLGEQQEILELAASLATRCGDAYHKANDRTRKLLNGAVFERLDVKGGRLCHEQYRPPFDGVFTASEFEHGTRVEVRCRYSNLGQLRDRLVQLLDVTPS